MSSPVSPHSASETTDAETHAAALASSSLQLYSEGKLNVCPSPLPILHQFQFDAAAANYIESLVYRMPYGT